jgi:hypothetical protein
MLDSNMLAQLHSLFALQAADPYAATVAEVYALGRREAGAGKGLAQECQEEPWSPVLAPL